MQPALGNGMNRMTLLLIGSAGQLGAELREALPRLGHVVAADRSEVDLEQPESIRTLVRDSGADVIINAAAYTAVDEAEEQQALAMRINGDAPGIIAEEARRAGALLVHYSTDYVFDGAKSEAYEETDPVRPLNVYGATKAAGDRAVVGSGASFLLFRIGWLYSGHHHNFLVTMRRLFGSRKEVRVVNDQRGAPTLADDIAQATCTAIDWIQRQNGGVAGPIAEHAAPFKGIYHLSSAGAATWFEFAQAILDRSDDLKGRPRLLAVSSEEYGARARRPANSLLDNRKVRETLAIQLPDWKVGLDRVMRELVPG